VVWGAGRVPNEAPPAPRDGVWGGGIPLPTGREVWGGGCAPSPEKILTSERKMAHFGAFWVIFLAVI